MFVLGVPYHFQLLHVSGPATNASVTFMVPVPYLMAVYRAVYYESVSDDQTERSSVTYTTINEQIRAYGERQGPSLPSMSEDLPVQ